MRIALLIVSVAFALTSCDRPQSKASAVGRYAITYSHQSDRYTFLLDTETGKTWVAAEDGLLVMWVPVKPPADLTPQPK